jgi:hypothetical protein
VIGDLNFSNIKWSQGIYQWTSSRESDLISKLNHNNVSQLISEPTRFRQNQQPSILDLLLTTDADLISQVTVGDPIGISDHCRITFDIQVLVYNTHKIEIKTYKKISYASVNDDLAGHDWSSFYQLHCVNLQCQYFLCTINQYLEKNSYIKSHKQVVSKPWIDHSLLVQYRLFFLLL